jgi:cytochrome c oxidase subunit 3
MSNKKHPYHILELSPWPILVAFSLLFLLGGVVFSLHRTGVTHHIALASSILGMISLIYCTASWWSDVIKEGRVDRAHNPIVQNGLKMGMLLFIFSEVAFFGVFFSSFFNFELDPVGILDGVWVSKPGSWPPAGIQTFDPWHIPFFNTLILLLSGTTVTWAHYAILNNKKQDAVFALQLTVILGAIFSLMQTLEYMHSPFGFKDGIYASNFYMATGFHGAHVIIGTIFLAVCLKRAERGHFDPKEGHLGFEFAAWYWHFVDVVWLFLFVFVYVLGR